MGYVVHVILIILMLFYLCKNKKNSFKNKPKDVLAIAYKNYNYKGDSADLYKDNKYLLLDSQTNKLLFNSIKIRKHAVIEYIQIFNIDGLEGEHKIISYNKNKTKLIKNIKKYLKRRLNMNSKSPYKIYIKL
jgi:hypothetical protein